MMAHLHMTKDAVNNDQEKVIEATTQYLQTLNMGFSNDDIEMLNNDITPEEIAHSIDKTKINFNNKISHLLIQIIMTD